MAEAQQLANQHGLPHIAYEGGHHFVTSVSDQATFNALDQLFKNANRDARMGAAYTSYLTGWKNSGGELFVHLGQTSPLRGGSYFNLKEYPDQPAAETPKYNAVIEFIDNNPCWWNNCEH